jgi:xanthine dehydrogenase accessory factor
VIITEIEKPKAVRRLVSFAEAVFRGEIEIEELSGQLVANAVEALESLDQGIIPVLVDPDASCRSEFTPTALVDARMMKKEPELGIDVASGSWLFGWR